MQCVKCAQQGAIWVLERDRGLIKRINSGCCSEMALLPDQETPLDPATSDSLCQASPNSLKTFQDIIKILSSETKLCYDS